jgi:hypothetical protein
MRSFDVLSRAEFEIRGSSQPRHHFEMSLVKWIHLRKMTDLTEIIESSRGSQPPAASPKPHASSPKPEAPSPQPQAVSPSPQADVKSSFLAAIRAANKMFFGMVVQQATEVVVQGDSIVFSFPPAQKSSRADLERRRPWLEELASASAGRKMTVMAREVVPPPTPAATPAEATRQRELRDKAKANPGVQAILEVFGGDVEDVEEIN